MGVVWSMRQSGEALPPGTVIALSGPLGAGKTVFARGVASVEQSSMTMISRGTTVCSCSERIESAIESASL